MFEIGNTLREARLRRGLDILDCEAETKIRAKYLRAMEEEQFDLMPSPTYVRGFLRTYADFLDLDGRLVLDEYESRFGEFREFREFRASESGLSSRVPRGPGAPRSHRELASPTPRRQGSAPRRRARPRRTEVQLLWLAIGGVMTVALLIWLGVGESSSPTVISPTSPPGAAGLTTTPAVTEPDTDSTERPQPARRTAIVLTGTGENGCWVEVRSRTANGRVVFTGIIAPGQTQTFRVAQGVWVRASNPAELDVKIGRRPTTTLGTEGGAWLLTTTGVQDA
jgi:cytoskeleton protein RodZ